MPYIFLHPISYPIFLIMYPIFVKPIYFIPSCLPSSIFITLLFFWRGWGGNNIILCFETRETKYFCWGNIPVNILFISLITPSFCEGFLKITSFLVLEYSKTSPFQVTISAPRAQELCPLKHPLVNGFSPQK